MAFDELEETIEHLNQLSEAERKEAILKMVNTVTSNCMEEIANVQPIPIEVIMDFHKMLFPSDNKEQK